MLGKLQSRCKSDLLKAKHWGGRAKTGRKGRKREESGVFSFWAPSPLCKQVSQQSTSVRGIKKHAFTLILDSIKIQQNQIELVSKPAPLQPVETRPTTRVRWLRKSSKTWRNWEASSPWKISRTTGNFESFLIYKQSRFGKWIKLNIKFLFQSIF